MNIQDFTLLLGEDEIPWRLFSPKNANEEYAILWLQGWTSSMDSHKEGVERMAQQTNMVFVTMDYAGHGLHQLPLAKSTRKQQHEEVIAVFDEIKKLDYEKIIVIGGSFGGYQAALLTSMRPVHAAVLRAPANYPDEEFELAYEKTPRSKDYLAYTKTKELNDSLINSSATKSIKNYDRFVYVLEHELDETVPAKVPRHYFEAAKHGNYLIIPKTKHSPKLMSDPQLHYTYIENVITSILENIRLERNLSST